MHTQMHGLMDGTHGWTGWKHCACGNTTTYAHFIHATSVTSLDLKLLPFIHHHCFHCLSNWQWWESRDNTYFHVSVSMDACRLGSSLKPCLVLSLRHDCVSVYLSSLCTLLMTYSTSQHNVLIRQSVYDCDLCFADTKYWKQQKDIRTQTDINFQSDLTAEWTHNNTTGRKSSTDNSTGIKNSIHSLY